MSANQILAPRERHSSHDSRHAHHERARAVQVRSAERKFVTILFADVEGSMGLSGSIGLDEWWDVMDDLFELMCEGVCRFGGWVGAFTGDGIKAIFEAPGTAEEHARRGCQAALWLRDAMPRPARLSRSSWNFSDSGPKLDGYIVTVVAASSTEG
jgi:class 3 adenylate cyclase